MSSDFNLTLNGNNVNNYVLRCSSIPIVKRNRDWTPIFSGFNFELSSNVPNDPEKNQLVVFDAYSENHFLGFLEKIIFRNERHVWDCEVTNYLMKLDKYRINFTTLHTEFLNGIADFTSEVSFTVDTDTDLCETSSPHGLTDGMKLQVRSSGTLPGGLEVYHNYYVIVYDSTKFRLCENYSRYQQYLALDSYTFSYIDLTSVGSGTHTYTTDIDDSKYNDWSPIIDIPFTADPNRDQILSSTEFRDILGNGPDIVMFDSTGTLPAPLIANQPYIAKQFPEDVGFVLYADLSDYSGNSRINITDTGSGTHSFTVLQRTISSDYRYYPTALISLEWLFKVMARKIGAEFDSSNIDSTILHKFNIGGTDYTWNWKEIYLVESMLYNINQSQAEAPMLMVFNAISGLDEPSNNTDEFSEITFLEFVQNIFGKLGFAIKFTGNSSNKTYSLYPQKRDVNGVIQPGQEDVFDIDDSDKVNYSEDTIIDDQGGYARSRSFIDNISFRYNDYSSSSNFNGTLVSQDEVRSGAGRTSIDWYNNLRFLLLDKTGMQIKILLPGTFGYELFNIPFYSAIINQTNALLNFYREEITCKADYLSQGKWTVREISLDVEKRRIDIIQEQCLLASG